MRGHSYGPAMGRQVRTEVDERLRRLADRWTPEPVQATPIRSAPVVEVRTWSGRALRAFMVLGIALSVIAAYLWWQGRAREVTLAPPAAVAASIPPEAAAAGSATPVAGPVAGSVVVDVSGSVRTPGLITLPAGSRVADAVARAGGAVRPRDLDAVNLARVLVDGEQILIGSAGLGAAAVPGKPSVNTATLEQLDAIAGVGPVLAQRIIDFRTEHGPLSSLDQLDEVSGVGSALLARLRTALTL